MDWQVDRRRVAGAVAAVAVQLALGLALLFGLAPGLALLDTATCRLVRQRLCCHPARDAEGRPVEDVIFEEHRWVIEP